MDIKLKTQSLKTTLGQRNNLVLLCLGLFILNFFQGFINVYIYQNQRVEFLPLPAFVSKPFYVSQSALSAAYLKNLTQTFVLLRLNYNPATLQGQLNSILTFVAPQSYTRFKAQMAQEIKIAKLDDVALKFTPLSYTVNAHNLSVEVSGTLNRYVGSVNLPPETIHWQVGYEYQGGRLWINRLSNLPVLTSESNHG